MTVADFPVSTRKRYPLEHLGTITMSQSIYLGLPFEPTVNREIELPPSLDASLQAFLDSRPDWDQQRVVTAAISLFLLQNRETNDRDTARIYLDSLFKRPA